MLCSIYAATAAAYINLPHYADDDEFKHCANLTRDWDQCGKEETVRVLNSLKQNYARILGAPQLNKWQGGAAQNTIVLRDMYEAWTAFRNRYCSLSVVAKKYLEPIVEPSVSCNLYQTLYHEEQMRRILRLLTSKNSKQMLLTSPLFVLDEHDAEYEACLTKDENKRSDCVKGEINRATTDIKNLYKEMLEDTFIGKWNNGPDLKRGNYRDMFDSWVAFRNRICSLADYAYKQSTVKQKISRDECVLYMDLVHKQMVQNALREANSMLDEEYYDETDAAADDDGGAAEGKKIAPLQRSTAYENNDDSLTEDKKADTATPAPAKDKLPSWAQQK